jgi:rubrerythrin
MMSSLWKKLTGGKPEGEAETTGQYGADYVGVSDLMKFNQNLLDAQRHEQAGLEFYRRFLEEANDERGREMYRRLIEEEERHLKMIQEEIDEHKKSGYWS